MSDEHGGSSHSATFFVGLFLGGLLGAIVVFLLGTKKGKKILEDALEKVEEYEEGLEDHVATMQEKSEDLLHKVQQVKDAVIEQLETKKEMVSDEVASKIDTALAKIERVQQQGMALTEEVHKKFFVKDGKRLIS